MNVLITSLGSNTSIAIIKALKMQNVIDIILIGTDTNSIELCAGSKFVDYFFQIPSSKLEHEYETMMISIIKKFTIDVVIPVHDSEIYLISKLKIKYPTLTNWSVNEPDIINLCNNKVIANLYANEAGLTPPESISIDSLNDHSFLNYNIVAKPINGVSSNGIYILASMNDFNLIKNNLDLSNYLFQQKIIGEEYTVDCYSTLKGKFYGGVVRHRIETKSGIAVKSKVIKNDTLINFCELFLNKLRYVGASNLQFIINKSGMYFIEINPRFSGAGILSYKSGFNSPLFTLLEYSNIDLVSFDDLNIEFGLIMTRYWEECFANE
jgi:carbamoyl-phosphate synthase large subunit